MLVITVKATINICVQILCENGLLFHTSGPACDIACSRLPAASMGGWRESLPRLTGMGGGRVCVEGT